LPRRKARISAVDYLRVVSPVSLIAPSERV
jgi:hypothetical protein